MRVVARIRDPFGWLALVLTVLLASPGVRVSHAEDFSYDPALEPAAVEAAAAEQPGQSCGATSAVPVTPLLRIPLFGAEGDEELNSLNSRGYNIGKIEPDADLQRLLYEVRQQKGR